MNLEYLAKVVQENKGLYYPDTLVGTDSHTTMINGLGILGWGVGGIEAEAGMLGQPVYFLTPDVIGVRVVGKLREGVTATDLVLRVTEILRKTKVVGKFVEFFGPGSCAACRFPTEPSSAIWRQNTVRLWLCSLLMKRHAPTSEIRAERRIKSRLFAITTKPSKCLERPRMGTLNIAPCWNSTWKRSSPALRDRSGRRTGSRCGD